MGLKRTASAASAAASRVRVLTPEDYTADQVRVFLAAGPATASELASLVLQSRTVPQRVVGNLERTLLEPRPEFVLGGDGRWRLATPGAARAAAEPLESLSFVVVDVETTGMSPDRGGRITEIAAVVVRDGRIVEEETYATLVNPGVRIPPFIARLTGITDAMVCNEMAFASVCEEITERLEGHIFVAHNASFDWGFVSAEVERASPRRLAGRPLCTVRLARKLLPQLPRRSLDHVTRHYGIDIGDRHRALGDAEATAKVLMRLLEAAADRGVTTWDDLDVLLSGGTGAARRRRRSALPTPVPRAEDGR